MADEKGSVLRGPLLVGVMSRWPQTQFSESPWLISPRSSTAAPVYRGLLGSGDAVFTTSPGSLVMAVLGDAEIVSRDVSCHRAPHG